MTARLLLFIAVGVVLGLAIVVGIAIGDRDDPEPVYEHVETTNGTTPSTLWPETQPALGDGFDELLAGVARAKAAHRPKARTAPTATIHRPAVTATVAQLEQIIGDGFARFGAAVAEQAVEQAWCETAGTLDPNSTGDEGEVGLLQIHPKFHTDRAAKFGWTMADLYDPYKNVVVGADIYAESGWGPWTCQPS